MYDVVAPNATSKFSTYGLHQRPSQTVSPSPPLPPKVKQPTPEEIRKLIPQVPECKDPMYTKQVKAFLEDAAVKMERDHVLDSLHALRSAAHAIIPAHKADLAVAMPSVYTAAVFTAIPPAAQSSATSEMKQSRERTNEWRSLQKKTLALADRIRKNFFHGVYNGPSQMARLSEAEVSARDKVAVMADTSSALDKVLAMAAVTGQDVSFPTTSDTSQKAEIHEAGGSGNISISAEARKELTGLPATDKVCINAYIEGAQRAADAADHYLARQYLARAHAAAVRAHAHELTKSLVTSIRAMQTGMQVTHGFGGPGHGGGDNKDAPSGNSGKY
jgi:hypothetical protein